MPGVLKYWNGSDWVEVEVSAPVGPEGGTTTLTTKGDLLTRSSSALVRLPVATGPGTNGMLLSVESGETSGLKWADIPSPFLLMGA